MSGRPGQAYCLVQTKVDTVDAATVAVKTVTTATADNTVTTITVTPYNLCFNDRISSDFA